MEIILAFGLSAPNCALFTLLLSWQFNQSNLEAVFIDFFFFAKCACPFLIRDSMLWKLRHHGVLGPCQGAASISTEKPLQSSPCGVSSLPPPWCWYGREVLELRLTWVLRAVWKPGSLKRHKPRSCSLNHQSDDSYCTLTLLLDVAQILGWAQGGYPRGCPVLARASCPSWKGGTVASEDKHKTQLLCWDPAQIHMWVQNGFWSNMEQKLISGHLWNLVSSNCISMFWVAWRTPILS